MKPKWKLIFNWYQNSIIVLTRHAIALSSWAVSITINSLIFFEAAPRQRRSVVRAPTRKPRVRSSNLGGEKAKNFPTWNICFTPFLRPIRVYYDPQKVWLQFIKVELYPSQKRGVCSKTTWGSFNSFISVLIFVWAWLKDGMLHESILLWFLFISVACSMFSIL